MATTTDEILVKFRTDGGQEVEQTFRKTADASDLFHQKVSRAGNALGDLRLKSEARVAGNLGAIAQALTGGASAGEIFAVAITKATESFRGSLLFAGAATVGFALYEGITKAGEAVIALDTKIADLKRSTSVSGDFIGADQVNKNLDTALTTFDELRAKFVKEHTGLGGQYDRAVKGLLTFSTGGEVASQDELNITKARQSILGALEQTAEKQKTLNAITREGLSGDERKAALAKIEADHKERAARIAAAEVKVGIIGGGKASQEETKRFEAEKDAANKLFDQQKFQLDLERDLARVQTEFLRPQEQSLTVAEAQVRSLEKQLDLTRKISDQERQHLNSLNEGAIGAETRAVVQNATSPLYRLNAVEDRSVAARIAFEEAKADHDFWESGRVDPDRLRHIKELHLFQDQQRLNDLNDVRSNTINFGASGRVLDARQEEQASNLRQRINAERASLGLRAADEKNPAGATDNAKLLNDLGALIQTLNALPAKIGVL